MDKGVPAAGVQLRIGVGAGRDKDGGEGIDEVCAATAAVLSNVVEKIYEKELLFARAAVEIPVPDADDLLAVLLVDQCPL